jgi:hypothetical protein
MMSIIFCMCFFAILGTACAVYFCVTAFLSQGVFVDVEPSTSTTVGIVLAVLLGTGVICCSCVGIGFVVAYLLELCCLTIQN